MLRVILSAAGILAATSAHAETYRLVHAIGKSEKVIATDLSKQECETLKGERKTLIASLGIGGSITCLPEGLFND